MSQRIKVLFQIIRSYSVASLRRLSKYCDFANFRRKTEDTHFLGILKMFSNYMSAATIGSYITAKSPLFQDRFGSIVVAAVLVVILANTPTMNKTQRTGEILEILVT